MVLLSGALINAQTQNQVVSSKKDSAMVVFTPSTIKIDSVTPPIAVSKKIDSLDVNAMANVFNHYFELKDALVSTNGINAAARSSELFDAINAVKMDALSPEVHTVWMKVFSNLKEDAEHIADTQNTEHQREHFTSLSKNMYALMKVAKSDTTPTYFQYCPMANEGHGANWLSKEKTIKNPYFGSKMMSCGSTKETLN